MFWKTMRIVSNALEDIRKREDHDVRKAQRTRRQCDRKSWHRSIFFLMARRADHVNDIDPGTAKRSRKPSKSDRKRRKVGIFTSDVCLFYAEMNHHLNLFNTFFFTRMAFLTGAGTKQGTFISSNKAEEKHAGPGHLDVFVACYLLFASHNFWSANIFRRRDHSQFGEDHEAMHHQEARFHHVLFFVERLLLLGRQDRRPNKSDEDKVGCCISD